MYSPYVISKDMKSDIVPFRVTEHLIIQFTLLNKTTKKYKIFTLKKPFLLCWA